MATGVGEPSIWRRGIRILAAVLLGFGSLLARASTSLDASCLAEDIKLVKPGVVWERTPATPTRNDLRAGDVILQWSGQHEIHPVSTPTDLWATLVARYELDDTVLLGQRNRRPLAWSLTSLPIPMAYLIIGLRARPNFSESVLSEYKRGEILSKNSFAEASALWMSLSHRFTCPQMRSWLLGHGARALVEGGSVQEGAALYDAALRELRHDEDLIAIEWLFEWGSFYLHRSDLEKAAPILDQLERRIEQSSQKGSLFEVQCLSLLSNLALKSGSPTLAEDYLKRALIIGDRISNRVGSLIDLGILAFQRANLQQSEDYFQRALTRARKSKFKPDIALALYSLGWVARQRGDLISARRYFRESLSIKEKVSPSDVMVMATVEYCGMVARDAGNLVEAEKYLRRALELSKNYGDVNHMRNLDHMAILFEKENRWIKAQRYLEEAVQIGRQFDQFVDSGWAHNDLAEVLNRREDREQAEKHYREAIAIFSKTVPGGFEEAQAKVALAALLHHSGKVEEAAALFEEFEIFLEMESAHFGGTRELQANLRAQNAIFYHEYVDLLIGQGKSEKALDILEQSRARTLLGTLATANVDIHHGADAELLKQDRELQQSLRAKSEQRMRLLNGSDRADNAERLKSVEKEIAELNSSYQEIEGRIRSTSPAYAALIQPQPLSAAQIQQTLLDQDTLLLEYSLGEEQGHVFAVTPDSLKVFDLPRRSDIERVARRAHRLIALRNLGVRGETSAQRAQRTRLNQLAFSQALAELSRMVLGPLAAELGSKRLLVVADGALAYIPFAVLPEPTAAQAPSTTAEATPPSQSPKTDPPLIVHHEIVNLPSASVLAVLRQQEMSRPPAPHAVAVLADPVFDKNDPRVKGSTTQIAMAALPTRSPQRAADQEDSYSLATGLLTRSAGDLGMTSNGVLALPRLRYSRQEADSILAVTPQGEGMRAVDFEANRSTATNPTLSQYRIVHFATHGLLNSEHPELSGLVLSLVDQKGRPRDGFLGLEDIYNLNLPADLVVLSACETGLGKEISGEGLIGLTRGFMYAGASRVMASLWKVSDVATAHLMAEFYKAMEQDGMRPAAALRAAQIRMLEEKRWSSPYFWAAFQIQGEWR